VVNSPVSPIPLWDVEEGIADLGNFQAHGEWIERLGRQYALDSNSFGLPAGRTVDLNIFDLSLFSRVQTEVRLIPRWTNPR
jgi:hypothetical protein